MMMMMMIVVMSGVSFMPTAAADRPSAGLPVDNIINAINYGYVFTNDARLETVHAKARLIFIVDLPDLSRLSQPNQFEPIDCNTVPKVISLQAFQRHDTNSRHNSSHMGICTKFNYLINNLQALSMKINQDILAILNNIYSLLDDFDDTDITRNKRSGWFPILGRMLQTITNTATLEDIDKIQNVIQNLKLLSLNTSQLILNERNEFFATMKLQSTRMSNLIHLSEINHESIETLYNNIKQHFLDSDEMENVFTFGLLKMANFSINLNKLSSLRQSISALLNGNLTPEIISHSSLVDALNNLRLNLTSVDPALRIIKDYPHYYYLHSRFSVIRSNTSLIILLDCPLTYAENPLNFFKFHKFPLHLQPSLSSFFSELEENFFGILFHPGENEFYILESPIRFLHNMFNPLEAE